MKIYIPWIISGISYITSTLIFISDIQIIYKWIVVFVIGFIGFTLFARSIKKMKDKGDKS